MPPLPSGLPDPTSLLRGLGEGLKSRLDFAALLDQRGRMLTIECALPSLALIPETLVLHEGVSRPFELVVECLSTSAYFELKTLIGEQVSVRLLQSDGSYKPWHGYVFEAAQLGADGGLARYRLVMRPWLGLLALRRDAHIWQDKTALEVVEDVFADYPQAHFRIEVSETLRQRSLCTQYRESDLAFVERLLAEEGLAYRFEHLDGDAAKDADAKAHARHVLVIGDRAAVPPSLGEARFTSQHPVANLAGQRDAVTAFASHRRLQSNAVTLGAWDYEQLAGSNAATTSALDNGELPPLEIYDGSGAYRYENAAHAERAAGLALAAVELGNKAFEGQGSTRHFGAGATFKLVDHPLYGANTSALNYSGAIGASRERGDNEFLLLAVEHHAANNLGAEAAALLGSTEIEHGSYRNRFEAVPAAAPLVLRWLRKPTAPGAQTALVVGLEGEALTTERDHRVKVQFPWQRGERPLAGGLSAPEVASGSATGPSSGASGGGSGGTAGSVPGGSAGSAPGNAPGNERSGTWVRIALPAAGANWGAVLVPRIGTEVLVEFVEGDIDRPLITGQLYNGQDRPPFSAGEDSGVNHAGVISGMHTHTLDQVGFNQWVMDDASGQLRMRLLASYTQAELGLGHLVGQSAASAQRGAWRGSGFEATTQGWASLRAERGLLLSGTARTGTYGSAQSTQMDAAEAVAQLRGALALGQRLSDAAAGSTAHALKSFAAGKSIDKQVGDIDPTKRGKHEGSVNGQEAKKAVGRTPGDPVEAFASPQVVIEGPSTVAWSSEASIAGFSGQDLSIATQGDAQQTAGHTWASVSGNTTSLFTYEAGIKAIAANGAVSLRAHTDELKILADKDVTVISVNDEIRISAKTKIEIVAGQSSVVLDGANITFKTPGKFEAKFGAHAFLAAGNAAATLPPLPVGGTSLEKATIHLDHRYHDNEGIAGAEYVATFPDGSTRKGTLDGSGRATISDAPGPVASVVFGPSPKPYGRKDRRATPGYDAAPSSGKLAALVDRYAPGSGAAGDAERVPEPSGTEVSA